MSDSRPFKLVIACQSCGNQYFAQTHKVGEALRCSCGELITIPEPKPHSADVVNCSACGGGRVGNESSCSFCGVDFTLHEQDLHTICPACMTRISNRANYCHACALPITASKYFPTPSSMTCPSCQNENLLYARSLDINRIKIMECHACAGVWLERGAFKKLESKAKAEAKTLKLGLPSGYKKAEPLQSVYQPLGDKFYRPCAVCERIMHRQQYGPGSKVVIDVCHEHGIWFDNFELSDILRWVRKGGLAISKRNSGTYSRGEPGLLNRGAEPKHDPLPAADWYTESFTITSFVRWVAGLVIDIITTLVGLIFTSRR